MSFSKLCGATLLVTVLAFSGWALNEAEGADLSESSISAEVNKTFRVVVESNPSTGYSWTADFDKSLLKLEDSHYVKPAQQIPGKGGQQVFVFLPLKSGRTTVQMQYKRSWEPEPADIKKFSISISDVR